VRLVVSTALALAVAAPAGASPSGVLWGTVTRGPTTPVCRIGTPCSERAAGAFLVFSRAGRAVARVRVGARGAYSVRLAPGEYRVRAVSYPRISPLVLRVVAGKRRHVDLSIDTGIR